MKVKLKKPLDVYILGAGASKAEIDEMPVMGDFFKILAENVSFKQDELWRCLALLDYHRLFRNRHAESENLAAQIFELRASKKKNTVRIKNKVRKYLKVFLDRVNMPDFDENLEDVFDRALFAPNVYGQSPKHRLQASINNLFSVLEEENRPSKSIYKEFVKKILSRKNRCAVFISFNYDIMLDRALFNNSSWNPLEGYGYKFENTVIVQKSEKIQLKKALDANGAVLLKPHGSLCWRYETNLGYDTSKLFLTVDKNGSPVQEKYYAKHVSKNWKNFLVLVTPPVTSKIFSQPILYETRMAVKKALQKADTVNIIGWSLPETDQDMMNVIQRIYDNVDLRVGQLKKLSIVDFTDDKKHYARMQSLFMAKRNEIYDKGFRNYVEKM